MGAKVGNENWKYRKANRGGRPRVRPLKGTPMQTSCVGVGDVAVEAIPVVDTGGAIAAVDDVGDDIVVDDVVVTADDVSAPDDGALAAVDADDGDDGYLRDIVDDKKRRFLLAYSTLGNIVAASKAAKCGPAIHYWWMKRFPEYAEAFETTKHLFSEKLIAECHRRATMAEHPSDNLLMFSVKSLRSEFKDNYRPADVQINVVGKDNKVAFDFSRFRQLLDD